MPWTPRVAVVEFVAPGGAAANAVERAGVAAAGRAVFRVEVRVPRPARVHIKVHGAFAQKRSWPALVGLCTDRGRVAGRRLVVSEALRACVRGRGGDREEEAYSASRHLRRTQSGPAAGAGSRGETRPPRENFSRAQRALGGAEISRVALSNLNATAGPTLIPRKSILGCRPQDA